MIFLITVFIVFCLAISIKSGATKFVDDHFAGHGRRLDGFIEVCVYAVLISFLLLLPYLP